MVSRSSGLGRWRREASIMVKFLSLRVSWTALAPLCCHSQQPFCADGGQTFKHSTLKEVLRSVRDTAYYKGEKRISSEDANVQSPHWFVSSGDGKCRVRTFVRILDLKNLRVRFYRTVSWPQMSSVVPSRKLLRNRGYKRASCFCSVFPHVVLFLRWSFHVSLGQPR